MNLGKELKNRREQKKFHRKRSLTSSIFPDKHYPNGSWEKVSQISKA